MFLSWRDALIELHVRGWDADDIDHACEAIHEACTDGELEGVEILELSPRNVAAVLDEDLPRSEARALLVVADLRAQEGHEADELQRALYDLDAFAYEYAGDD